LLLGAEIWVAHLVAPGKPATRAMALSAKPGQIYLPYLITSRGCRCWSGRWVLGRRRVRGGRGGSLAGGPSSCPRDMAHEYEKEAGGLQGCSGQAAERLVLVGADSVSGRPGDKTENEGGGQEVASGGIAPCASSSPRAPA